MANIRSSSLSPAGFVMTREAVSVCMCSVASVYTCTRLPMGAELVRHSLSIVFSLSLRLPASRSLAHISPFYILMKFKMIMKKTRAHTHTHHLPRSSHNLPLSVSCLCLHFKSRKIFILKEDESVVEEGAKKAREIEGRKQKVLIEHLCPPMFYSCCR